jgi:hypothetical protein
MNRKAQLTSLCALIGVSAALWSGCKTTPEIRNRPDFLTSYNHLQKVDDLNWRYVSVGLDQCSKFIVSPVKILFNDFQGKPITAEQRQRSAEFIRQNVIQALVDRYPIVSESGPDVGEIRIALTDAYRTGGKLGLSIQGEILDNSNTQVAAVMRTELSELYSASWENKGTARAMVETWCKRLRQVLDEAHRK